MLLLKSLIALGCICWTGSLEHRSGIRGPQKLEITPHRFIFFEKETCDWTATLAPESNTLNGEPVEIHWAITYEKTVLDRGRMKLRQRDQGVIRIPLEFPKLRSQTDLRLSLTLEIGNERVEFPLIVTSRTPFLHRQEWLKRMNISLLGPKGKLSESFDSSEIPHQVVRAADCKNLPAGTLLLIDQKQVNVDVTELSERGINVFCIMRGRIDIDIQRPDLTISLGRSRLPPDIMASELLAPANQKTKPFKIQENPSSFKLIGENGNWNWCIIETANTSTGTFLATSLSLSEAWLPDDSIHDTQYITLKIFEYFSSRSQTLGETK